MKLLVATRNHGKQREFRSLLADLDVPILFPDDVGIAWNEAEDTLETGTMFEENARAKAEYFAGMSGLCTLADDSGLEVAALDGAPGVRSRRYAGVAGLDHLVTEANNQALLRALFGVPVEQRQAQYRCVLALIRPAGAAWPWSVPAPMDSLVVAGITHGRILGSLTGTGGFGYDPLFWSEELGISFAEATAADKHAVSHRGRAVAELIRKIKARL